MSRDEQIDAIRRRVVEMREEAWINAEAYVLSGQPEKLLRIAELRAGIKALEWSVSCAPMPVIVIQLGDPEGQDEDASDLQQGRNLSTGY